MAESVVREKSFQFALEVSKLYRLLQEQHEYVISKQLLRSGTSLGANVEEAGAAQCRRDFLAKMAIASKEARETAYWLRLLQESRLADVNVANELSRANELIRIQTAIVKSTSAQIEQTQNSQLKTQNFPDAD